MSFTPPLSLFVGLGILVGGVAIVLAIIVDRIDRHIDQLSIKKSLTERGTFKKSDALQSGKVCEHNK
jgi:hypothetical protein